MIVGRARSGSAASGGWAKQCRMAEAPGLRRLLIDYDSTLNPGQGNAPLTEERAALLARFLTRWKAAGVELFVLTSSNPVKKVEALEAAGLRQYFADVLSSTMPKRFESKGDFIAKRIKEEGWAASEQLLADDSVEAVQSVLQTADGEPRVTAHTLRLKQHSAEGLVEEDLTLLDSFVSSPPPKAPLHYYSARHEGPRFVDERDSHEKCMLDSLPAESLQGVLQANPAKRLEWVEGRPDFAAAAGISGETSKSGASSPATSADPKAKEEKAPNSAGSGAGAGEGVDKEAAQEKDGSADAKAKDPPSPKAAPKPAAASGKTDAVGEGCSVEVTSGPHAGRRGIVLKVTGTEGEDRRWRVFLVNEGGGTPTWVDSVKPAGGESAGDAPGPASSAPTTSKPAAPRRAGKFAVEGSIVEVTSGIHAGKRGTVAKVTGDGNEKRWRVAIDDGPTTWCNNVDCLDEGGEAADEDEDPCGFGKRVEVLSNPYTGKHGLVLKVSGQGEDKEWKVLIDGVKPPQVVRDVQPIGVGGSFRPPARSAGSSGTAPRKPPPPARPMPAPEDDYLVDDSSSEASDPDMPELEPF